MHNNSQKISIIMPMYNCEDFIEDTINSVLNQTYDNWELIIVDDASTDNSEKVLKDKYGICNKIIYYRLEKNSGAAIARNCAIKLATGDYIAFLDSDDLWRSNKLEVQINTMIQNEYDFSCTYYDKIDQNGRSLNSIIKNKKKMSYKELLKYCPGNSTVMYKVSTMGKIKIPNIKKRNDYVMWLKAIKKTDYLYCIEEVLSSHRIRTNSLSNKKTSLVYYHWKVYREIEKLSLPYSIYLIAFWIKKTLNKRG